MPRLLTTISYQKLDDKIYLFCSHCGHPTKTTAKENWLKKMTSTDPSQSSRTRSQPIFRVTSPKHFLTWSATAANHKIQKLSKHLAQNVSKLQTKVDRVFHNPAFSSTPNESEHFGTSSQLNSTRTPTSIKRHSTNGSLENSQEHQHLLSVNNVHVAVVHNLNLTKGQIPKRNNIEATKVNNLACPSISPPPLISNAWKVSCRSRKKLDFELERSDISKSWDIFELTPLNNDGDLETHDMVDLNNSIEDNQVQRSSASSNNTTGSEDSLDASTISALSPHWSRSSSWTSTGDIILPPDEHDNNATQDQPVNISLAHAEVISEFSTDPIAIPTVQSELSLRILEEEPELRQAPWFHAGIPREIALEVLKNEVLGSFIVRESSTRSGCFALSLRVPREFQASGIAHYLIVRNKGYKIKGFTKEFGSLTSLITHHSVMPELLPCPLYRPSPLPSRVSRANSADFVEPEKLLTFALQHTAAQPQKQHESEWRCTDTEF